MTGDQNTGENGMSRCAVLGTVTAVGFASNDRRSEHALSQVVGRLEVIDIQETQEVRPVLAQAFGKAGIIRVGEAAGSGNHKIEALFESASPLGEHARGEGRFLSLQGQGFLQESGGLASKVQ